MRSVPRSLGELTPAWLTDAIAARCPGAVVGKLVVGEIEDGTNRRARVEVGYDEGDGPPAVFVKIHGRPAHRGALVALGALTTEARLARSGVSLPLAHPLPFAAAIDRSRLRTIVVMDDVTEVDGRPNDAVTPLSVDEVRDGLAGLAALHASYWDRPLPESLGFLRPWRLKRRWAPVSAANLTRGIAKLRRTDLAGLADQLSVRMLEREFRSSASLAASGPMTVLHGDPHPGNTYSLPRRRTGFLDWQLARTGNWSHDVGYFVVSSLTPADRRSHDRELMAGYVEALRDAGVASAPSEADAWERYRATPAYGLGTWLHTFAAGSFQRVDTCLESIRRFAVAYDDLDTKRSLVAD
ncbi:MAG: phosphotransferase [Frankiaceae bacterium]|nr:phosphotransferase [Frankiaceae bacterium]